MMNPLVPLANALLAARTPCPAKCMVHHQSCECAGTGHTWPAPLKGLAKQVLSWCRACDGLYPVCDGCGSTGWVPLNPAALSWPEGWSKGILDTWYWTCPEGEARALIATALSNAENTIRNPETRSKLDQFCIEDMAITVRAIAVGVYERAGAGEVMPKPEHNRFCPQVWTGFPAGEEPRCPACAWEAAVEATLTEVKKRLTSNRDTNRQEFIQDFISAVRERVKCSVRI